jgi:2,4-dienoyl-CoA reductase-like NADH-dependent reductase (Old Yellow Enzyme family)
MATPRLNFSDRDALLEKARELGVDIPYDDDISVLLESITIGDRRVVNRMVVQPMEGCDAGDAGAPADLTFRRYRRYGAGGSAVIWFEATAVEAAGRSSPRQLLMHDGNTASFKRLTDETRRAARERFGSDHPVLLILQLTHAGRYARPEGAPRPIIAQRNRVLDARMGLPPDHPIISDDELDRLQDVFVAAARCAADAGFDGVDVKACHGYLVSELLAAFTRANSRYGESFENRTRFLREVIERIGDARPELLVTSRFSAWDGIPHPFGFGCGKGAEPAEDPAEPMQLAILLRELGCPLLNVSVGNPYYAPHYGRPFNKPVAGGQRAPEHPLEGVARLLRIAGDVQRAVPDVPLVGTGYSWLQQHIPDVGAAILRANKAALIGLGRCAFAYPDAVIDLMKTGRLDPNGVCVACSCCSQLMRDGGCAGCVVRDGEIYAAEYRAARRRAKRPGSKT